MIENIIFKQKLKYIFGNKRNKKSSSLFNHIKESSFFNSKDSFFSKKTQKNLFFQKLSRNENKKLDNFYLKNETTKNMKSIFNLTLFQKQNINIDKMLKSQIKPYSFNKKEFNKTINLDFYKKKSDLIMKNYFEEKEKVFPWKNPFKDYKDPQFLYEILKNDKIENSKKINELKPITNCKKYILNKNNNNNLSYLHSRRIDSLTQKVAKNSIIKNLKAIKKEEKRKLNEIELKDKVEISSIKAQIIKKLIYNYLMKDTDINEIMCNEKFYKKKENIYNFIFDGLKLPTITNRLIKNKIGENYEWKNLNAINTRTLLYLNQRKYLVQKNIDKKNILKKINKKQTFTIDENNIIHFEYKYKDEEIDNLDKEYLYDCHKYLSAKILSYKNVNIPNNILLKKYIYNNSEYIYNN